MTLTEEQQAAIDLLKECGVGQNGIVGTMLAIKDDYPATVELILWLYDNHPTEQEIMQWLLDYLKKTGRAQ